LTALLPRLLIKVGGRDLFGEIYSGDYIMFQGLFQPMHLLVVLLIALIVFGPGKLGDIGDSLGKAIKGFKKAMDEPEIKSDNMAETDKITGKNE
jgi:sec-independent protein translocase protein TatA